VGSGILTTLEVEGDAGAACIVDLVLSGSAGEALDALVNGCLEIVYEEIQLDCEDEDACNFMEPGDCVYPEENYDCDDNCIVDVDCLGICGGDAEFDSCGACDGPGENFECWDGSLVCDASDCEDEEYCGDGECNGWEDAESCPEDCSSDDGGCDENTDVCLSLESYYDGYSYSHEINYDSSSDIAGFQFSHNGCVTGASGGDAEANGFTVSYSGTTVLAFSFAGDLIPEGSGTLVVLEGEITADCLYNFVFSGPNGMEVSVGWDDGPPECAMDCPGIDTDYESETEDCTWFTGLEDNDDDGVADCLDDCDDETLAEAQEWYEYCIRYTIHTIFIPLLSLRKSLIITII
jgi:hypothetical protein